MLFNYLSQTTPMISFTIRTSHSYFLIWCLFFIFKLLFNPILLINFLFFCLKLFSIDLTELQHQISYHYTVLLYFKVAILF